MLQYPSQTAGVSSFKITWTSSTSILDIVECEFFANSSSRKWTWKHCVRPKSNRYWKFICSIRWMNLFLWLTCFDSISIFDICSSIESFTFLSSSICLKEIQTQRYDTNSGSSIGNICAWASRLSKTLHISPQAPGVNRLELSCAGTFITLVSLPWCIGDRNFCYPKDLWLL